MPENMNPNEVDYQNVREAWPLYDTILISPWTSDKKVSGWFTDYQAFSAKQTHPFFNVRNMGETGLAYCNMETKDQMPFAYHIYSLGVSFQAAIGRPANINEEEEPPQWNFMSDAIFIKDMPQHIGLRLRVSQDQKILTTCYLAPEGTGPYGLVAAASFSGSAGNPVSLTSATQGIPELGNRWKFPSPIAVPRGATFSAELELSEYGRELMGHLCGPEPYNFACYPDGDPTEIDTVSSIRVSLIGKREVQQRGELHYG